MSAVWMSRLSGKIAMLRKMKSECEDDRWSGLRLHQSAPLCNCTSAVKLRTSGSWRKKHPTWKLVPCMCKILNGTLTNNSHLARNSYDSPFIIFTGFAYSLQRLCRPSRKCLEDRLVRTFFTSVYFWTSWIRAVLDVLHGWKVVLLVQINAIARI